MRLGRAGQATPNIRQPSQGVELEVGVAVVDGEHRVAGMPHRVIEQPAHALGRRVPEQRVVVALAGAAERVVVRGQRLA